MTEVLKPKNEFVRPENADEQIAAIKKMNEEAEMPLAWTDDGVRFMRELQAQVENCEEYELYHVLVGSTPDPKIPLIGWDIPGKWSIQAMLDRVNNGEDIMPPKEEE